MGAFLSANKNGYWAFILTYLADKNVYVKDQSLLPYTPSKLQTYVDLWPALYNPALPETLVLEINGIAVASGVINTPLGLLSADLPVPLGSFTLVTRRKSTGETLRIEKYNSKYFAWILGVMAQGLDERLTAINLTKSDQRFSTIRTSRLYPVVGVFFEFAPPPGWEDPKYRAAILGGCGPGFTQSFLDGGTKGGVEETIKSITCQDPVVKPARNGIRWVVRTRANWDPTDPNRCFYVRDRAHTDPSNPDTPLYLPHRRAVVASGLFWDDAVDIDVPGSQRSVGIGSIPPVPQEDLVRVTESFLQSPVAGPYNGPGLDSLNLKFTIRTDDEATGASSVATYYTAFPMPTHDAITAAANIRVANPTLTDAVYADAAGHLRIGVYPQAGKVFTITIVGGTALPVLGLNVGDSVEVAPDNLANPWIVGVISLVDSLGNPFVQGVDFTIDISTGEVIWIPSTVINNNVPPAGTVLFASYVYEMRREIQAIVSRVKDCNDIIKYAWQ